MAKGGARVRSGPAKSETALRRERDEGEFVKLKMSDRVAVAPEFPLADASSRELAVWNSLWGKPQGLMWERQGLEWTVALYVRQLVTAESGEAKATDRNSARQLGESLGLTPQALKTLGWKIERDDVPSLSSSGGGQRGSSARGRPALKLVSGDAVEGSDS